MNNFQTPPPYNGNPGQYPPGYRNSPCPPRSPYCPPPGGAPYGAQQPWQPYVQPMQPRTNGMGTAGFVLSLVGVFLGWIPLIGWLIWLLGAIFSFIGLFRAPRGLAVAGTIISLVLIPVLVTIFVVLDVFTSALFLL